MQLGDPNDKATCSVSPAPGVSVTKDWGEADAVPLTSVGCVVERPFAGFVARQVLRCGSRGALISYDWAETGGDCKIPSFGDHVFPVGNPDVGRSVKAGPLWKAVGVRAELEQTGLLLLWTETCLLDDIGEDVGLRNVPAITVPGAWADCGVVADTIEDLATQEHCVPGSSKGTRKRCCSALGVRSASQSKESELAPPTSQAPARGDPLSAEWFAPSRCPACLRRTGWTQLQHVRVACRCRRPRRLLERAAVLLVEVRGVENGVSGAESALLDGGVGAKLSFLSDSSKAIP